MENSYVIASYLRRAKPSARLSRDEELSVVRRARDGDPGMTERLVEAHVAFVIRVAMEFRGRGLPFEDLVHEGCFGLLRAIRRFDPENGARFMTYAAFWVRKAILESLADGARVVHVPRYQHVHGRPVLKEIRLDDPAGAKTLVDRLADEHATDAEADTIADETVRRLRRHVSALPPRDQAVLSSRFGLHGEPAKTLKEVGSQLSLSRERVRQIESSALEHLRRAMTREPRRARA